MALTVSNRAHLEDKFDYPIESFILSSSAAAAVYPSFRSAAAATTPPNQSSLNFGTTVVIPVPTGTIDGDIMFAVVFADTAGTPPAGWTLVASNGTVGYIGLYSRVASSEPASYTWTGFPVSQSRAGSIVTIKDGNTTLGDSAIGWSQFDGANFPIPNLNVAVANSMVLAFAACDTALVTDVFTANAPLTLRISHCSNGAASYSFPYLSSQATEELLPAGTLSGLSFTNASAGGLTKFYGGVIIKPI